MPPTRTAELVMALSDEELWKVGDYSLLGLDDGTFRVTSPVFWARNIHGLASGAEIEAFVHRPTGALVLWPSSAGSLPTSGPAVAVAEG